MTEQGQQQHSSATGERQHVERCAACVEDVTTWVLLPCFHVMCVTCFEAEQQDQQEQEEGQPADYTTAPKRPTCPFELEGDLSCGHPIDADPFSYCLERGEPRQQQQQLQQQQQQQQSDPVDPQVVDPPQRQQDNLPDMVAHMARLIKEMEMFMVFAERSLLYMSEGLKYRRKHRANAVRSRYALARAAAEAQLMGGGDNVAAIEEEERKLLATFEGVCVPQLAADEKVLREQRDGLLVLRGRMLACAANVDRGVAQDRGQQQLDADAKLAMAYMAALMQTCAAQPIVTASWDVEVDVDVADPARARGATHVARLIRRPNLFNGLAALQLAWTARKPQSVGGPRLTVPVLRGWDIMTYDYNGNVVVTDYRAYEAAVYRCAPGGSPEVTMVHRLVLVPPEQRNHIEHGYDQAIVKVAQSGDIAVVRGHVLFLYDSQTGQLARTMAVNLPDAMPRFMLSLPDGAFLFGNDRQLRKQDADGSVAWCSYLRDIASVTPMLPENMQGFYMRFNVAAWDYMNNSVYIIDALNGSVLDHFPLPPGSETTSIAFEHVSGQLLVAGDCISWHERTGHPRAWTQVHSYSNHSNHTDARSRSQHTSIEVSPVDGTIMTRVIGNHDVQTDVLQFY